MWLVHATGKTWYKVLYQHNMYVISLSNISIKTNFTRCLIQDVVSPHCGDKRMVRRCMRRSLPNYFDMTSYQWNARQNTVAWHWWKKEKNNVTSWWLVHATGKTWYKVLYQHNMYVISLSNISIKTNFKQITRVELKFVQYFLSHHTGDKRMVQCCTRHSLPNYFDMTSYHWNVRQNTETWHWWMKTSELSIRYNLISTCAGECDWLFHWQHELCATFSASVNINYRLPIKVYYRICTLRHIRIEINHGSQNVFWALTWEPTSLCSFSLMLRA
jgi:hypothetical protein